MNVPFENSLFSCSVLFFRKYGMESIQHRIDFSCSNWMRMSRVSFYWSKRTYNYTLGTEIVLSCLGLLKCVLVRNGGERNEMKSRNSGFYGRQGTREELADVLANICRTLCVLLLSALFLIPHRHLASGFTLGHCTGIHLPL